MPFVSCQLIHSRNNLQKVNYFSDVQLAQKRVHVTVHLRVHVAVTSGAIRVATLHLATLHRPVSAVVVADLMLKYERRHKKKPRLSKPTNRRNSPCPVAALAELILAPVPGLKEADNISPYQQKAARNCHPVPILFQVYFHHTI